MHHMNHQCSPNSNTSFCRFLTPLLLGRMLTVAITACLAITLLNGCSAGKEGLLSITPTQYFHSAKERLEVLDERNYEIRDLDEIIRVLENAEKDAKKGEIVDRSRLYLVLAGTLKARKQYFQNLLKGQYRANRAEPFLALDVKPVQETLRTAKKWLRLCKAGFKTESLRADFYFIEAFYYMHKMLTQTRRERADSLRIATEYFRLCLAVAPEYASDFRLFGRSLTPREVRLRLIECLALGEQPAEAYALLSQYEFSPIPATSPGAERLDFPWYHTKGLVLAMMGQYEEAAQVLAIFKLISPKDYPTVEEALWVLEGVYDRLRETTGDERFTIEARIVASLLKRLQGPFAKEQYTTAAHLFPRWLPGDLTYFKACVAYHAGDFITTQKLLQPLSKRGLMASGNGKASRLLRLEAELYGGAKVADEILEEVLTLALDRTLPRLQREQVGFLLGRYLAGQHGPFGSGLLLGEGQTFVKSLLSSPWALDVHYKRGFLTGVSEEQRKHGRRRGSSNTPGAPGQPGTPAEKQEPAREPASLLGIMFAQRPNDWIVSVNVHLLTIPELSLIGDGRIVGREEEGSGWLFKGEALDELRRGKTYLALFEFDNSDSEKSVQGYLLDL